MVVMKFDLLVIRKKKSTEIRNGGARTEFTGWPRPKGLVSSWSIDHFKEREKKRNKRKGYRRFVVIPFMPSWFSVCSERFGFHIERIMTSLIRYRCWLRWVDQIILSPPPLPPLFNSDSTSPSCAGKNQRRRERRRRKIEKPCLTPHSNVARLSFFCRCNIPGSLVP